jgi:hypothetical protein
MTSDLPTTGRHALYPPPLSPPSGHFAPCDLCVQGRAATTTRDGETESVCETCEGSGSLWIAADAVRDTLPPSPVHSTVPCGPPAECAGEAVAS